MRVTAHHAQCWEDHEPTAPEPAGYPGKKKPGPGTFPQEERSPGLVAFSVDVLLHLCLDSSPARVVGGRGTRFQCEIVNPGVVVGGGSSAEATYVETGYEVVGLYEACEVFERPGVVVIGEGNAYR